MLPSRRRRFREHALALFEAIVRHQVNRKGVYMTSFITWLYVILRSCFHQNQRFALTTIVMTHRLGCVSRILILRWQNQRFETLIQKRRSKTPFTGVLFMIPSRRRRFREHALRIVRGYCSSSSEPERRLNVVICDFAFMLPPESAFCSSHDRKRTFFGVLNRRFETTFIRK